jgi:hypothetical protein
MSRTLIVVTDLHVAPDVFASEVGTVVDASDGARLIDVVVPMVLPPTLPITACPPRIATRLGELQAAALRAVQARGRRGRVTVEACRSVPALLRAVGSPDELVLIGSTPWAVRRAARGCAPEVTVVPTRKPAGRQGRRPLGRPRVAE